MYLVFELKFGVFKPAFKVDVSFVVVYSWKLLNYYVTVEYSQVATCFLAVFVQGTYDMVNVVEVCGVYMINFMISAL